MCSPLVSELSLVTGGPIMCVPGLGQNGCFSFCFVFLGCSSLEP